MRLRERRRFGLGRFRFIDCLCTPINGGSPVSEMINLRIGLASKHALNERGGFDELVCTRKPRCLEHHVIHIESYPLLETKRRRTLLFRVKSLSPTRFFVIAFYRR